MRCRGWCGECYSGGRGRGAFPGHLGHRYIAQREGLSMGEFLRRYAKPSDDKGVSPALEACKLTAKYPGLAEFLSSVAWTAEEARETGTVLICTGDGRWRAWLNDRDGGVTAWVSAGTLTGLLDALEQGLVGGGLEWRKAKVWGGGGGRKK